MKHTKNSFRKDGTENLDRLYKGSVSEDKIALMGSILLAIKKERGITVEDLAVQTGISYAQVFQLTGMLETDGIISRDLLQRCFINFCK